MKGELHNLHIYIEKKQLYVNSRLLNEMLKKHVDGAVGDPIRAMVDDDKVTAGEMCQAAIDQLYDPTLDPDGAVEVFDVDLGKVVALNNNRRIAGGFDQRVQRALKGAIQ